MTPLESSSGRYSGPERRHYAAFITQNSEYYCRDNVCFAVCDVNTGKFLENHPAIGRKMTGGIRISGDGELVSFANPGERPHVGERLFFSNGDLTRDVCTSPLRDIARPPKEMVSAYKR